MATTLKDLGPTEKEIHVAVPQTDIQAALDKSFNELRKQIVLPGFRAGKVPRGILERRFGDQVRGEVWQELVQEGIQDAMKEYELEPVSEPKLKDLPGGHDHDHDHEGEDHDHDHAPKELLPKEGDFEFSFSVEIKADFELPKYRGLSATRKIKQVVDSDIDEVLKSVADRRAEWMPVEDENAVIGETDLIAGMATLGTGERVVLDDSPISFMPQTGQLGDFTVEKLAELVEGKKVDDEITLSEVMIPEDYEEEVLRGMTLNGKVVIDAIKRQVSPAIDDELAKAMGMDDLEAFKKDIRENLVKQHERLADRDVVSQILDQLVEAADIPLAPGPVDRLLERRTQQRTIHHQIEEGLSADEAKAKGEAEREEARAEIERDNRKWLIVEKISKKEKIFCLEDDVDESFQQLARENGVKPSMVREYYEQKNMIAELRAEIVERKVCEFLRDQAKISDEEMPASEGGADAS